MDSLSYNLYYACWNCGAVCLRYKENEGQEYGVCSSCLKKYKMEFESIKNVDEKMEMKDYFNAVKVAKKLA